MKNISDFIKLLEQNDELVRIPHFVSIDKEIAEINDRVVKSGGKALLFENNETSFPVLVNMFGSQRRIALALRVNTLDELTQNIDNLFKTLTAPKPSLKDKLKVLPLVGEVAKWLPKNSDRKGECQEVILQGDDVDLGLLPILISAPFDAGAFVTLPLVNTIDPETLQRNVGMYRMQVMSKNSTGMHWHKHKTGERHYQKYKQLGQRMPVSVCLGGDPAYTYSATAPLPDGIDEYILSGYIRRKPVKLVKCITNELRVPADCDFVIEGYVDTQQDKVTEGPFGDHTGFYSLQDKYPVFHVTCITRRRNAIYTATVVGVPPQEDAYIGMATEKLFLAPIKAVMQPDIRDMHLPIEGVAHNIAIIDIEKIYTGQGFKVASAMWGAGQMMFNKFIVVTSGHSGELTNYGILKEPLRRLNILDSVTTSRGPLDVLDHNSQVCGYGGKLCFDFTRRVEYETEDAEVDILVPREIAQKGKLAKVSTELAQTGWSVIFVGADRVELDLKAEVDKLILENGIVGVKLFVVVDREHDLTDYPTLVWVVANNTDPLRDSIISAEYIIFDARSKFTGLNGFNRDWPNVVLQSEQIIESVDKMWEYLGLGEFVESPSRRYEKLRFSDAADVKPIDK